jgi:hypothetical protein
MKIVPKPITTHRGGPAIKVIVESTVPRDVVTERAYQQLVTSQDVAPDRANQLLGREK